MENKKFTHISSEEIIVFEEFKKSFTYSNSIEPLMKPNGIWFSEKNKWRNWCDSNMPDWSENAPFDLDIDLEFLDILVISKFSDLIFLQEQYGFKYCEEAAFEYIDWLSISKEFKGIYFENFSQIRRVIFFGLTIEEDGFTYDFSKSNFKYLWYSSLDISSGCVWDIEAIKSFNNKPVLERATFENVQEGDKITYVKSDGEITNGIVKSKPSGVDFLFAVYNCNSDWDNYKDYTGQNTEYKDIIKGWLN